MKTLKKVLRKLAIAAAIVGPLTFLTDAFIVEPEWLIVREVRVPGGPGVKIVHFSDIHFRGDRAYLEKIVDTINGLAPDFVCFTGDVVDRKEDYKEALEILEGIEYPMFGVPGNHDFSSETPPGKLEDCFDSTGGAWLQDQEVYTRGGICITGTVGDDPDLIEAGAGSTKILLTHYPDVVDKIEGESFDLILAGHSHGGQVRIPFDGPLMVPGRVGRYNMGLYQTPAGPMYVNPGIGTFYVRMRFLCRPEITVIKF